MGWPYLARGKPIWQVWCCRFRPRGTNTAGELLCLDRSGYILIEYRKTMPVWADSILYGSSSPLSPVPPYPFTHLLNFNSFLCSVTVVLSSSIPLLLSLFLLLPHLFQSTLFPTPSYPASRLDLKSPLHVWNNLLAETRRIAKEHCGQAEVYTNEMTARFDIMAKDVHVLSRKVRWESGCVHFVYRNSLQHDCLLCIASVCA